MLNPRIIETRRGSAHGPAIGQVAVLPAAHRHAFSAAVDFERRAPGRVVILPRPRLALVPSPAAERYAAPAIRLVPLEDVAA